MKSVGRIWRRWHRIDGGGVNSLRPYVSLRVPQELIEFIRTFWALAMFLCLYKAHSGSIGTVVTKDIILGSDLGRTHGRPEYSRPEELFPL